MKKELDNIYKKLEENGTLDYVAGSVDGPIVCYKGARLKTFELVRSEAEFSAKNNTGIIIYEEGKFIEENLRTANKYFILQKFAFPKII